MRFLVDAQLPPSLARWLVANGHEADHVIDCGLESAGDRAIWDRALGLHAVVLTKDEDFAARRVRERDGPAVVWIRVGNVTRRQLLSWIESVLPAVLAALERGEIIVEIASSKPRLARPTPARLVRAGPIRYSPGRQRRAAVVRPGDHGSRVLEDRERLNASCIMTESFKADRSAAS
jgi:predicted nuclease of predicted toxin-antitoxin system